MIAAIAFVGAYIRTKYFDARIKNEKQIERLQKRRLRRQLKWITRHSRLFGQKDAPAFMDKDLMMDRFNDLNTRGLDRERMMKRALDPEVSRDFSSGRGDLSVGLSSGTSGRRGLFVTSGAERGAWAGSILARALPRGLFHPERIALVLRAGNRLYDSVRSRRHTFRFFDLLSPFAELSQDVREFDPTVLVAPASVLRSLADEEARLRQSGSARLRPVRIYSVAEVLHSYDEAVIQRAFGVRVFQIYQCTEGFLGISCAHGSLHLNEDIVRFEFEKLGETGRVIPIVTDMYRRTQPIVRYRLGDVLELSPKPCSCGSPRKVVTRIEGREGDVLYLPTLTDGTPGPVFADLIVRTISGTCDNPGEYYVVQTETLVWTVGLGNLANREAVATGLLGMCAALGYQAPELRFEIAVPRTPGQKLRRVRRICPIPERANT